jgi:hypothetical protein
MNIWGTIEGTRPKYWTIRAAAGGPGDRGRMGPLKRPYFRGRPHLQAHR